MYIMVCIHNNARFASVRGCKTVANENPVDDGVIFQILLLRLTSLLNRTDEWRQRV